MHSQLPLHFCFQDSPFLCDSKVSGLLQGMREGEESKLRLVSSWIEDIINRIGMWGCVEIYRQGHDVFCSPRFWLSIMFPLRRRKPHQEKKNTTTTYLSDHDHHEQMNICPLRRSGGEHEGCCMYEEKKRGAALPIIIVTPCLFCLLRALTTMFILD